MRKKWFAFLTTEPIMLRDPNTKETNGCSLRDPEYLLDRETHNTPMRPMRPMRPKRPMRPMRPKRPMRANTTN